MTAIETKHITDFKQLEISFNSNADKLVETRITGKRFGLTAFLSTEHHSVHIFLNRISVGCSDPNHPLIDNIVAQRCQTRGLLRATFLVGNCVEGCMILSIRKLPPLRAMMSVM